MDTIVTSPPLIALLGVALLLFLRLAYNWWNSPCQHLPGPPSSSFWYGSIKDLNADETNSLHERWVSQYGPTFTYKGLFGRSRLYTVDVKAIQHILHHNYDYEKLESTRFVMSSVIGNGVLVTEGDKHRSQRKVMNPAFGPAQIREFGDIFLEKSVQLRDIWSAYLSKHGEGSEIDVLSWFSKATLDIISIAGFNYQLDTLSDTPARTEFHDSLDTIFQMASASKMNVWRILQAYVPALRILPSAFDPNLLKARATMLQMGKQLLEETRTFQLGTGEKGHSMHAKDLLSLMVRSNMSEDVSIDQRMNDEDVIAQVPTFLVAGHETTSTALAWTLFSLAENPEIQSRLRAELLSLKTENPTMDQINSLLYLDAVIKETLRIYCPVTSPNRVAMKDDVIPLSRPFKDKYGVIHNTLPVRKGQTITIPIISINRDKYLWGEDAKEFKPERWSNLPEAVSGIPGVWGNTLTFLGGARSCIGWRFAVMEMKVLLFTLIRTFEYEMAVPKEDIIVKRSALFQKPVVKSRTQEGRMRNELPLLVKTVKDGDA